MFLRLLQIVPPLIAFGLALWGWPRLLAIAANHAPRPAALAPACGWAFSIATWIGLATLLGILRTVSFITLVASAAVVLAALRFLRRDRTPPEDPAARTRTIGQLVDRLDRDGWRMPRRPGSETRGIANADARRTDRDRDRDRDTDTAGPGRTGTTRTGLGRPVYAAVLFTILALHVGTALQASPGAPLGYVHLLTAKNLGLDLGPFASGVLPLGLPALMAAISALFSLDPVNVLRSLVPLTACLIALAAGELSKRIGRSVWAGAAGAALVGLSTLPAVGAPFFHLTTPLAPELALAMALMATSFAWDVASDAREEITRSDATDRDGAPRWSRAGLYLSLGAATALDPWMGAVALVPVGALVLWGDTGPGLRLPWQEGSPRVFLGAVCAALLGTLPVVVGLFFLGRPVLGAAWSPLVPLPTTAGALLPLAGVPLGAAAVTFVGTSRAQRTREGAPARRLAYALLMVSALTLAGPGFLRALATSNTLLGVDGVALATGSVFYALGRWPLARPGDLARVAMASILCGALLFRHDPRTPSRYEPVGSGEAYLAISGSLPHFSWTIISPVDQYSEVLGRGFHVELAEFVRETSDRLAAQPSFRLGKGPDLRIRTPEVFLFVDLRPSGLGRAIRPSDAHLPLPPLGAASEYDGVGGAAIEARALAWADAYLRAHPRGAEVFLQTRDLLVLRIQQ